MIHIRDECTLCYIYLSFVGGIKGMDNNTWNGRMLIITVVKHDDDQWSRESPELRKIKYIYISNILRFDLWLVARAFSSFFYEPAFFFFIVLSPFCCCRVFLTRCSSTSPRDESLRAGMHTVVPFPWSPTPLLCSLSLFWFGFYTFRLLCVCLRQNARQHPTAPAPDDGATR